MFAALGLPYGKARLTQIKVGRTSTEGALSINNSVNLVQIDFDVVYSKAMIITL